MILGHSRQTTPHVGTIVEHCKRTPPMGALPGLSVLTLLKGVASHTTVFRLATILQNIRAGTVDRSLVKLMKNASQKKVEVALLRRTYG